MTRRVPSLSQAILAGMRAEGWAVNDFDRTLAVATHPDKPQERLVLYKGWRLEWWHLVAVGEPRQGWHGVYQEHEWHLFCKAHILQAARRWAPTHPWRVAADRLERELDERLFSGEATVS